MPRRRVSDLNSASSTQVDAILRRCSALWTNARSSFQRVAKSLSSYAGVIRWTLAIAAAVTLVLVVIVLPFELIGFRNMVLTPKDRLDAEAAIRNSLIQVVGGAVLLVGLYFTSRSFRLTREGHITDRYTKAIEQLGNENPDVRIGGIYALERIAKDSAVDRYTIVEVLSTFVREHTREGPRSPKVDSVSADTQAAISVLGRRPNADSETKALSFYHSGLSHADFTLGKFRNAHFYYSCLDGALFWGATLENAGLSFCTARGASFNHLNARGANFVNATYTNGWFLGSDFTDADFFGCNLSGSDFGRRYAEKGEPVVAPSLLTGANFTKAILARTNFKRVDLRAVRGLTREQLRDAITDENTLLPEYWQEMTDGS